MTTEHSKTFHPRLIDQITDVLYQMGDDWTEEHCPDLDKIACDIVTMVVGFPAGWYVEVQS